MSKYLIRAANFVAEISNDDELLHLANVGTVQKDTKLCELPGKTWIQAKDLPALRHFWGIENHEKDEDATKDDVNDKNQKVIPIPSIMPPRLETVVDNFPKSIIDDDNTDATQVAQAPMQPADETPQNSDNTHDDAHESTHNTADKTTTSNEHAGKKEYQSIASDVLDAICDNGEILSVNAIPGVTESALTFEVEKMKKVSNVSWNVPKKQNNKPETAQNQENQPPKSTSNPNENARTTRTARRQRHKNKDANKTTSNAQKTHEKNAINQNPKTPEIEDKNIVSANDPSLNQDPNLEHHDEQKSDSNPHSESTNSAPQNIIATDDQKTTIQNDQKTTIQMNDQKTTIQMNDQKTTIQNDQKTTIQNDPKTTIQNDQIMQNREDKQNAEMQQNISESPVQNDNSDAQHENTTANPIPENNKENNKEDDADKSQISIDIELDDIDSDLSKEDIAKTHAPNLANTSNQPPIPDADINFGQINPEDAAALYTFLYEEEEEEDLADRTTVGPSPTFLREPHNLVDNPDSLAKLGEHANQADSIKPYSPLEKDKKQDGPAIQFADDYAPTKTRYRIQPEKTQTTNEEEAQTRAWKSKHQAHVDAILSQANTKDLSAELNAAVSAFEAAKAASSKFENSNTQNIVDTLEDEKTKAYDFSSAQRLSRLENLKTTEDNAQKDEHIYTVPEDLLDENPSEIFKIRNRKELLKQIEASAMQERAQMELESARTIRKTPARDLISKDNLAIIDEESHSDKLKIRGRSELRRMLEAEAKAAEMDSIQAMSIVSTNDYTENTQGQLRSLFEEQDELHLYLANEIKNREFKVNLSALEPDDDEDDDLSDSLADQYPKRNNNAVAVAPKPVAEPTMITGEVPKPCPAPTSIEDPFFKEKLIDGESPIASFDTLFLTTHRIWFVEGNKKRITAYESHDIENVQWVAQKEEKNLTYLLIDIVIIIALCALYILLPAHSIKFIVMLIFCICLLGVFYIISFKKTLQIGLLNGIVLKSNVAITSDNRHQALEFLSMVESARLERKKQLNG